MSRGPRSEHASQFKDAPEPAKYLAFVDMLGFSERVLNGFREARAFYVDLIERVEVIDVVMDNVSLTLASDSMILVSDSLPNLIQAVQQVHMATLSRKCLVRGGIAYGKHVELHRSSNSYVLSEALTRAASLEKTIRHPCVVIDPEITIPEKWWPVDCRNLDRPVLHYRGHAIVNPFHAYWFKSGYLNADELRAQHPDHAVKYDWFIDLYAAVAMSYPLIPPKMLQAARC